MSHVDVCKMTWSSIANCKRKNSNVDKKKKTGSRRQKLEGRCSWKNICHRKCCSVISSHCFQLYTFQGGSSMIVHTYIDVRENLYVLRWIPVIMSLHATCF